MPSGFLGCHADSSTRDLPVEITGAGTSMSVEQCRSTCYAEGYKYAGVQNGNQCFCGNSYNSQGTSTSCTTVCNGDILEVCGGPWANDVWKAGPVPLPGNTVNPSTQLLGGNIVDSPDGRVYLTMQTDGNLVLYFSPFGPWSEPLWASNTDGHPGAHASMQSNGDLVVYAPPTECVQLPGLPKICGYQLWDSGTSGSGFYAAVQTDGNFVIYDANNNPHWASNTNGDVPPASSCINDPQYAAGFCPAGSWWKSCTPYLTISPGEYEIIDVSCSEPCGIGCLSGGSLDNYLDPAGAQKLQTCWNNDGTLDCTPGANFITPPW